jgi:hypothetical protein
MLDLYRSRRHSRHRGDTPILTGVISKERGVTARHLIIVSRDHDFLYSYLLERFRDDQNVEVVLDRRKGERRQLSTSSGRERRSIDRRQHAEIEEELRSRSHAILSRA